MEVYETSYEDAREAETTTIRNDGKILRMRLRGVEFSGQDFHQFCPLEQTPSRQLDSFVLNDKDLCACRLRWRVAISVMTGDTEESGTLHLQLDLGKPAAHGGIDKEELKLGLSIGEQCYTDHSDRLSRLGLSLIMPTATATATTTTSSSSSTISPKNFLSPFVLFFSAGLFGLRFSSCRAGVAFGSSAPCHPLALNGCFTPHRFNFSF